MINVTTRLVSGKDGPGVFVVAGSTSSENKIWREAVEVTNREEVSWTLMLTLRNISKSWETRGRGDGRVKPISEDVQVGCHNRMFAGRAGTVAGRQRQEVHGRETGSAQSKETQMTTWKEGQESART